MIKKIIYLGLSLIMLFSLAACQGSELAEYKANKSQALQDYADAKGESNYCKTDWAAICKAVTDGKQAVEAATTKPAVTKAYDDAKGAINAVEREDEKILKQFDFTDPKSIWSGNINDDFTDDLVIVILRRTSTYPELGLSHFKLDNGLSLEYSGGVRPPDYFFAEGNEKLLENYRQIIFIHLQPQGKGKIIETIKALEKLSFVKSAEPNTLGYPE